jgi:hypothetical protein
MARILHEDIFILHAEKYVVLSQLSYSFLMRKIFEVKVVEKIKHIFCSFFFENHVIYATVWKHFVEQGRP